MKCEDSLKRAFENCFHASYSSLRWVILSNLSLCVSVGDGACGEGAEGSNLRHEGGERTAERRATGADQTEDQTGTQSQRSAGRAGRKQRTEGATSRRTHANTCTRYRHTYALNTHI